MTDDEAETQAMRIVRESLEMRGQGLVEAVDGEYSRCDHNGTWQDPVTEELLCEEHATEHFEERHSQLLGAFQRSLPGMVMARLIDVEYLW